MTLEEYKTKKEIEFRNKYPWLTEFQARSMADFLSHTIDELKLPEKDNSEFIADSGYALGQVDGWNACIAEAERMRDLSIKGKR